MTVRTELWSEGTTELDFGEGTKVRIKNTTVTLKGKFYRDDSSGLLWYKNQIDAYTKTSAAAHAAIDEGSQEKYPHDAGYPIAIRVANLVKNLKFERSEKEKLVCMVVDRDASLRNHKQHFIDLRNKLIEDAKNQFLGLIDTLAKNRHTS